MTYRNIILLLVEDNPGDAHLIRMMLQESDYASAQLHVVGTLRQALEAPLQRGSVTTVLLDLNLPDSDGMATLLGIQSVYGDSAIIVLTGLDDEKMAMQALREGAQNYILKGELDANRLGRTLRYAIERHGFIERLREADRHIAERDLRFRMLVEHATDLTLLVDRTGKVEYTSPSVRRVFGYRKDLAPDVFSLLHPDDIAIARTCFAHALEQPTVPVPLVVRARASDEHFISLEGTVNDLIGVPGVQGVVVNLRDVTERVAFEERIAFDRTNLSAMINSTSDLVWSLIVDLRLIAANEPFVGALEQATGRRLKPGDNLMMLPDAEGVSPTEHWRPLYARALEGESFKVEEHMTSPVEAHIEISYSPIWEGAEVVGVACFSRDVSEHFAYEQRIAFDRSNLDALINSTQDNVWSLDRNNCLITANNAFLDALEGIVGRRLQPGDNMMLPDVQGASPAKKWRSYFDRAVAGETFRIEEHFTKPEERWIEVHYSPIREGKDIVGVAGFSRDITEARVAQQELERSYREVHTSELQKSSILDALPANIALLDPEGKIVSVNAQWRAFADANGFKGADHGVGTNYVDISRDATGMGSELGVQAAEGIVRSSSGEVAGFELEYPCDSPYERRWFRMQVSPLAVQGGGGSVVMHMDITARKLAEEEMLRNEATMAHAQAIAHFGTWELNLDKPDDPDAGPHAWSEEIHRIVGLDPRKKDVSLNTFFELVHPEDIGRVKEALEGTIRTGTPYSLDHRIVRPDGSVRWLHEEGALVRGPGSQRRVLGTVLDITDRKAAEEGIERLNAELEERVVERTAELLLVNEDLEAETVKNKRLAEQVANRNRDLMSSIAYASNIQQALIPEPQEFAYFKGMGLLFRPRDLVSGDFLWCHGTNERFVVAVGDCTGHGVPGAMMSMLGHDLLNHIVTEHGHYDPPKILNELNSALVRMFQRADEGIYLKDGMDIGIVVVDKATKQLTFSGAMLPLLVIRDGIPVVIPGSKVTIGGHLGAGSKVFEKQVYQLRGKDRLCLFTDGYADQFGGPKSRKFYRRNLVDLITTLHEVPAPDAARALDRHLSEWMGSEEQVDDVLVLLLDV